MPRRRADLLLVEQGLAPTREKARAIIMAGLAWAGEQRVDKPGALLPEEGLLRVEEGLPYVGRGGQKLAYALEILGLDVRGQVALDVGASTGGFTDCLLQRGVAQVYALDVGRGQLAWKLRLDSRVVAIEGVNARYPFPLPEPVGLATIDVSFIGLEKVVPSVTRHVKLGGHVLALVKPQFQAGREQVEKGGLVRDPQVHASVLGWLIVWAVDRGLRLRGLVPSPILGAEGNREFFILWVKVD
ncbi:MAG: TlyA family RNA methyltransferase [Chloroflexi bacterium]|nr:TlyA family RNA methyltransferase [Chloroflexota bacterium]